jgi:hypothetical protein
MNGTNFEDVEDRDGELSPWMSGCIMLPSRIERAFDVEHKSILTIITVSTFSFALGDLFLHAPAAIIQY